ncbi:hypothetical protein Bca4012_094849 [Brassica carinata]|uniref:Prolamin-like domain-containing protein n=2 Tax=Brassica TaxID=3705 RepID=A0A0D3DRZ2_BRAOL|nr:PREDICTED: fibronectin-binding protein A [Brassica oleracea var. oleracea]KAG2257693.1 hypothetical protein Bca52824_076987 [Brassica carinata]
MVKSIIVIVAICLVSLPNPTVGSQKKPWPMPSDLANHNGNFGDSKASWACSESSDPNSPPSPPGSFPTIPNIPGIPNIPQIPIPQIPGIPNIPIPQIPGIPNIPIPQIPGIPIIPGLPNIPSLGGSFSPFESVLVSQSSELEKCLTGDKSKGSEKCFSQVFSSWADNDLSLDKECCEIVLNMDKKCNGHLHMMFKSHFFAPLLQYSCHIKHA